MQRMSRIIPFCSRPVAVVVSMVMLAAGGTIDPARAYLPADTGFIAPAEEALAPGAKPAPGSGPVKPGTGRYQLRSEPMKVATSEGKKVFGLDGNWRPLEYIDNDYADNGDGTVSDRATGLTWQQGGSDSSMKYGQAQSYVTRLNRERFAGYGDWRLPTVPELMSLLEPKEKNGNLYIDPVFDRRQSWCWSADQASSGAACVVYFNDGEVNWNLHFRVYDYYVRAVRP